MKLLIHTDEDTGREPLLRWLTRDSVARDIRFAPAPAAADSMGAGEIVQALVTDVTSLGSLVVAIAAWRDSHVSRAETPTVTIERNGTPIVVSGADPEEIDRVVDALLADDSAT
ncbi:hypothetical protein ACGF3J_10590 [Streptomyces sp. NPDC048171]|uniref:effector-associated constant component EACC1 n=1 Tax=Streptomyces sp. NPDC048171 TaxID=3365504 RepID=UPI0037196593